MSELPLAFDLHEWVTVEVKGVIEDVPVTVRKRMCVQSVRVESDSERRFLVYGLTDDPCNAYYSGKPVTKWARESELKKE